MRRSAQSRKRSILASLRHDYENQISNNVYAASTRYNPTSSFISNKSFSGKSKPPSVSPSRRAPSRSVSVLRQKAGAGFDNSTIKTNKGSEDVSSHHDEADVQPSTPSARLPSLKAPELSGRPEKSDVFADAESMRIKNLCPEDKARIGRLIAELTKERKQVRRLKNSFCLGPVHCSRIRDRKAVFSREVS